MRKEELPKKRGLTVDEIISKYPMTVRILLVQLVEQIDRLQKKKPHVSKEFVEEHARKIVEGVFHREYTMGNSQTLKALKQMLKEAGVKIMEGR